MEVEIRATKLQSTCREWIRRRKATLEVLEELAVKVDEYHTWGNRGRLASAAVALGGMGYAASIVVTGGESALIGAGLFAATSGGVGISLSNKAEGSGTKDIIEKLKQTVKEDEKAAMELNSSISNFESALCKIKITAGEKGIWDLIVGNNTPTLAAAVELKKKMVKDGNKENVGAIVMDAALPLVGLYAFFLDGVKNGLWLPSTINTFTTSWSEIVTGTGSKTAEDIRKCKRYLGVPPEEKDAQMLTVAVIDKFNI